MDENPLPENKSLSPVVIFAAASALGAILIIVWAHHFGLLNVGQGALSQQIPLASPDNHALHIPPVPPHQPVTADQLVPVIPPLPEHLAPPKPAFVAMIAQGVAELDVKPKTVTLPNEQALEEIADLKRGDYAAAGRLAADVLAHSKLDGWGFTPFTAFMDSLTHGNDPALLKGLNEWVSREPTSALPYLVRAVYYNETGWNLRGTNIASMIPPEIYAMYEANQESAAADLRKAISLNPRIPWSYYQLLHTVSARGDDAEVEAVFQMGIKAYPGFYPLYRQRLYMLTPKWGGSLEDMYAFAAQYAQKAPGDSPLKFLYLSVYSNVLDAAWFDCRALRGDAVTRCVDDTLKSQGIPKDIDKGVLEALNLYKVSDPIRFSEAIWPVLGSLAASPGSSASGFGQILQTAASIMGSNNGLSHPSGHNSYMLDDVTAQVWARAGYFENAEQKYHDALADIEQTSFHEEAERDEAAKTVLNHLSNLYRSNSQWLNAIIAYDAAESVGGVNFVHEPFQKCQALFKLKHYPEAVTECTRVQQANNNFDAVQYYLGRSYEGLGQWDTALSVLAPVALGADDYRHSAAVQMSIDYGKKNDFAGELKSLNEHDFLFDTRNQDSDDLAVAFNNRCHAFMQLGRLQEALNDCNVSLKFGQLPEAIRKQQELVRMLADKRRT
jgi:hypothetical protein